jgi:hypothetical protein
MNVTASNLVFDPILPLPVVVAIGLVLAAMTAAAYFRVGSRLGRWKNCLLGAFRLGGLALVMLVLLQPSRLEVIPPPETQRLTLVGVDTSKSMDQNDADKTSRLEAAKGVLQNAHFTATDGTVSDPTVRLFEFSDDATPVTKSALDLTARGQTTRFHHSISSMLNSLGPSEGVKAVILLTDGHDFELVNPAKTGFLARMRQAPIYAVPIGRQGKVRDVSVHITSYQPYCYVKQKARLSATLRLIGCEYEEIEVELLRHNQVVQTTKVNAEENEQAPVQFEVMEPEVGQYEYEIRAVPLEGEADTENNSAMTYLNVIDQQIQVLLLEGSPYWDTTFLQRSLMRNDKIEFDAIVEYAPGRAHRLRKTPLNGELAVPATAEEFSHYDIVVLGRNVERLLGRAQVDLLEDFVKNRGGTVIFSRGPAFDGELARNNLAPVIWGDTVNEKVRLQVSREGQSAAPLRLLSEQSGGAESAPELIAGRSVIERKPLTATLASAQGVNGSATPGIVQRRFGQGQVVSVGVDGLWRWAFNAKVEGINTLFDRFWDQMVLWLMAGRDFLPNQQFSLRTSSGNVLLGDKAYFRVHMRIPDAALKELPIVFYHDDREVARSTLNVTPGQDPFHLTAEFLPDKTGKFRAQVRFPDGTTQETRFVVYQENLEQTEVATDTGYLKRLCESSGGRLLTPEELPRLSSELQNEKQESAPKTRLRSVWDRVWFFYLIGLLFGADWYLRRRWGLC